LTYQTTGKTLAFFNENAVRIHKSKIPTELMQEITGIAAGLTKAGVAMSPDDIIGWNAFMEMTGYWWPSVLSSEYGYAPQPLGKFAKAHCSAFAATGSATKDGKAVIGHESFIEFWQGQFFNIVLDITPKTGFRMKFQAAPAYISSMTDFWLNSAGIAVVETTIAGYFGYNASGVPEYVRVRMATQYGDSLDTWVKLMNSGNNGGYANMWILADLYTGEIAEYEEGLLYQSYVKKTDGYVFGDNVANDPRIRNLECTDTGYSDIRQQTGARRTRWPMILNENYGKIDYKIGQIMLGDTYDVYLQKINPSSRTICSHYDEDPQPYVSDPNAVWNVPFIPCGSVDGKVTSAELMKNFTISVIFGRADGAAFDADAFLNAHTQFSWQKGYLVSRPSQPWTAF